MSIHSCPDGEAWIAIRSSVARLGSGKFQEESWWVRLWTVKSDQGRQFAGSFEMKEQDVQHYMSGAQQIP
jgi:hypothetical protein